MRSKMEEIEQEINSAWRHEQYQILLIDSETFIWNIRIYRTRNTIIRDVNVVALDKSIRTRGAISISLQLLFATSFRNKQ